jgi:DNA-binding CsgD family transcriptional regulator
MIDLAARNREIVARVAAGATLQQVANAFGLTKQMIGYINKCATGRLLAPHRPEWPDDRVRALRVLWRKGLSTSMIALRLGVSKSAVVAKARRLDLPIRAPQNARPGPRQLA